jgi:hypothetical protein
LVKKIDPKLAATLAEKLVEAMWATTNPDQLNAFALGLSHLRQVESVDKPQIVVDVLKQPLAVMPLQLGYPDIMENKDPRTLIECLLAHLGTRLRKEPFPDLQSLFDWAKAHPEVDLDFESPPQIRITD